MKDVFLAGKMQGYAFQINCDALEEYINSNDPDFYYTSELQATLNYARIIQRGTNNADQHIS